MNPAEVKSYIRLKLQRNGYYIWEIQVAMSDKLSATEVLEEIGRIDRELKDRYPKNPAQTITTSFRGFKDDDDE